MTTMQENESVINETAVKRAVEGDVNVRLSVTDMREAYERLKTEGLNSEEIAQTLGVRVGTVLGWVNSGGPTTGRVGDPQASARCTGTTLCILDEDTWSGGGVIDS